MYTHAGRHKRPRDQISRALSTHDDVAKNYEMSCSLQLTIAQVPCMSYRQQYIQVRELLIFLLFFRTTVSCEQTGIFCVNRVLYEFCGITAPGVNVLWPQLHIFSHAAAVVDNSLTPARRIPRMQALPWRAIPCAIDTLLRATRMQHSKYRLYFMTAHIAVCSVP